MTADQLTQLKQMTPSQRWSKYTPLLLKGVITKPQYDWVLRYGIECKEQVKDAVESIIDAFGGKETTTHTNQITGKTQKERLKQLLSDGNWHSTVEIANAVYGIRDDKGICRIAARIHDLKQDGLTIESENESGSLWKYRLISH